MENKRDILEREKEPFPSRLRFLMDERSPKVTQKELADYLGLSAQSVSYYRQGRNSPDPKTLVKIAQYFNVSTDYLLGIQELPTANHNEAFVHDYIGLDIAPIKKLHGFAEMKTANPKDPLSLENLAYNTAGFTLKEFINALCKVESGADFIDSFLQVLLTSKFFTETDFDKTKLIGLSREELKEQVLRSQNLVKDIGYSVYQFQERARAFIVELHDLRNIEKIVSSYRDEAARRSLKLDGEFGDSDSEAGDDGKH